MTPDERKKFLAERALAIGGSDVKDLVGVEEGCERKLWYDKKGIKADYPFEGNRSTERGQQCEGPAVRRWMKDTGMVAVAADWLRHHRHPHMAVHLDRIIYRTREDMKAHTNPGVLEVKVPSLRNYYELRAKGPRLAAQLQLQWGLACSGFTWGRILAFNADLWNWTDWEFAPDPDMIRDLEKIAHVFWQSLNHEGNHLPRLDKNDMRCRNCPWRRTCQGLGLTFIDPEDLPDPEDPDEVDESILEPLSDLLAAQRMAKEAAAAVDAAKEALIARLGGPRKVRCALGRVVYTQRTRRAFSVKAGTYMDLRATAFQPKETDYGQVTDE